MTAPLEAPPGASRVAVSGLFFLNGCLFASWVSRIPALKSAHEFSAGQMGLALLALALGAALAMPPTGWLIGRVGSRALCRWSAILYCAFLPLLAAAHSRPAFFAALFGFGAAHGTLDVAMNAQAVAVERNYGRSIMSSFHALFSAGGLCGAAMGGLAAGNRLSAPLHFIAVGLLLLGAALAAVPRLLSHDAEGGQLAPPVPAPVSSTGRWFPAFPAALLILSLVALCSMMGEGAMADWGALYLRDIRHAGEGLAAAGYAAFSLSMAGVRLNGDRLAERWGRIALVRGGGLLAAAGLAAALLIPGTWVSLAGFACVGAGFATIVPMVFSAAGNQAGVAPGTALACVTTIGYAGFIAGPPLIGFAAEAIGLRAALGVIVATSFAIAALAGALQAPVQRRVRRAQGRLAVGPPARV